MAAKRVVTSNTGRRIEAARAEWEANGWSDAVPGMMVATSVARTHQNLIEMQEQALQPLGLTFVRYNLLIVLYFSTSGRMTMNRIAERIRVHPATVTHAVDWLEKSGHVQRRTGDTDRRTFLISLTPTGRELALSAALTINKDVFEQIGLTAAEAETLLELLAKVRGEDGL